MFDQMKETNLVKMGGSGEGRVALLASIVDSSNDPVYEQTLEGVITSWNRARNDVGYTAEEIIGKPVSILLSSDGPRKMDDILEMRKSRGRSK